MNGRLHGRHTPHGRDQGDSTGTSGASSVSTAMPGVHHKPEKVGIGMHPRDRIPGSHSRHCANAAETVNYVKKTVDLGEK